MSGSPYYYLHTNGEIIYKNSAFPDELQDSTFVRCYWPVLGGNRADAWQVITESLAMGVAKSSVQPLIEHMGGIEDVFNYAKYLGASIKRDGNQYCATRGDFINQQESSAGFGEDPLTALVELVRALGFTSRYMWGPTVESLVRVKENKQ